MKQDRPYDPWFGEFIGILRERMAMEGSEFGTGLSLFTLAVSIRAKRILEIGRNRGFSTFALASALRFNEMSWSEVDGAKQRPDMDYTKFEDPIRGQLISIEPYPQQVAVDLLEKYDLSKYVELVNTFSQRYTPTGEYDLMFIDGDHSYEGCLHDVRRFVPYLRPGGYFILHDWYGWYHNGVNGSPVKRVIEEHCQGYKQVLIDTGYMSFVVFQSDKSGVPAPLASGVTPPVPSGEILRFE